MSIYSPARTQYAGSADSDDMQSERQVGLSRPGFVDIEVRFRGSLSKSRFSRRCHTVTIDVSEDSPGRCSADKSI